MYTCLLSSLLFNACFILFIFFTHCRLYIVHCGEVTDGMNKASTCHESVTLMISQMLHIATRQSAQTHLRTPTVTKKHSVHKSLSWSIACHKSIYKKSNSEEISEELQVTPLCHDCVSASCYFLFDTLYHSQTDSCRSVKFSFRVVWVVACVKTSLIEKLLFFWL